MTAGHLTITAGDDSEESIPKTDIAFQQITIQGSASITEVTPSQNKEASAERALYDGESSNEHSTIISEMVAFDGLFTVEVAKRCTLVAKRCRGQSSKLARKVVEVSCSHRSTEVGGSSIGDKDSRGRGVDHARRQNPAGFAAWPPCHLERGQGRLGSRRRFASAVERTTWPCFEWGSAVAPTHRLVSHVNNDGVKRGRLLAGVGASRGGEGIIEPCVRLLPALVDAGLQLTQGTESSPDLVDAFPVADPPQHDVPVERLPLAAAAFCVRGVDFTCVRSAVRPLTSPYLYPTSFPRRVDHVSGPIVRGHEDVAARSTSVISFFPTPPGKTFSRCPIRVLNIRSCAQLLACGDVRLVPSGGSGTDRAKRSSGIDPTEQGLGNLIGAGADLTEQELGNLIGAGADPTKRGARELAWDFAERVASGTNPRDLAKRVNSDTNPGGLAERVNSGTNPGDLAERVNLGTNPRDLAEMVNSGTNSGGLAERVNLGTNPGGLAERVNSGTDPGDLTERVNSGINPEDLAERVNSVTNPSGLAERVLWYHHPHSIIGAFNTLGSFWGGGASFLPREAETTPRGTISFVRPG
ncbi:hypothetical protein BHM03_00023026 [Ensete ventricosum]|nr:hypothetical protein BHM03_00023026 [Ensete ventricosum]